MITIINYELGNIFSIANGFKEIGAKVNITNSPDEIQNATHLVLPGVGSCPKAIDNLTNLGLINPIKNYLEQNKPFLGICLGMQLLFENSFEMGKNECLKAIPGNVVPIQNENEKLNFKIPFINWSPISFTKNKSQIFADIPDKTNFYFVHSFMADPAEDKYVIANSVYDNKKICAAVQKGNITGTQFHPEKSGEYGLKILENFTKL